MSSWKVHSSLSREEHSITEQNAILFGLCCENRPLNTWACVWLLPNRPDVRQSVGPPPDATMRIVAAGGSPTERRTESLLGNSRTEGHLLGRSVLEQTPNRTPFCSAPLLVCLVCRLLHCQELARVTALIMMIRVFFIA